MVNRPKAIGTAAETLVTRWLRTNGYPDAERRALTGNQDQGDILARGPRIHGGQRLIIEVKAGQQTRQPGDADLDAWCRQADAEAMHAGQDFTDRRIPAVCLLVLQRHGTRDVSRWWTVTRGTWQGYVWRELGDALHDPGLVPVPLQPEAQAYQPADATTPPVLRSAQQ